MVGGVRRLIGGQHRRLRLGRLPVALLAPYGLDVAVGLRVMQLHPDLDGGRHLTGLPSHLA